MMPRTKIICTIGPASGSRQTVEQLVRIGMSVARLNFSHGTHTAHKKLIDIIRGVSDDLGKPVAILQDLAGPRIRVGEIREPGILLKPGQSFTLTNRPVESNDQQVAVSYSNLPEVITGGLLTSHKGINVPTGTVMPDAITQKDQKDLEFGIGHDVDYVALSFVRTAQDLLDIKNAITRKGKQIPVIAKIEKHEALDHIEEIMTAADGIMVARGDLGVEIPLEKVPLLQKSLIRKANALGKPVIIATQMLRSMVDAPRPTRAEAADVANAVLDGADAVMLSEETASGSFPTESLAYMKRITQTAESNYPHERYLQLTSRNNVPESVSFASCILADRLNATAILAPTQSGSTAKNISRFRPKAKIIALSPIDSVVRRLSLYWGITPGYIAKAANADELIESATAMALASGEIEKGDRVVITAGHPVWVSGTTNMLRVKQV